VRFLILVNGSRIGFFGSSRGSRQGDLLSPMLFVIVMEALGRMILATESGGLLSGFSMGTWVDISHLLFADDALLFSGADLNHLHNLRSLFLCFEVVSGLETNLAKLELVPVGNVHNVLGLSRILSCWVAPLPLKVFCWGHPIRPSIYGMVLLRR
jgi:hypothetical protein